MHIFIRICETTERRHAEFQICPQSIENEIFTLQSL